MQEADAVYVVYCLEDLLGEAEGGAEGEAAPGLSTPQLRQVLALQRHHHVVEAIVPPAPDEATHVLLAWEWRNEGMIQQSMIHTSSAHSIHAPCLE
jgi:hypothetical protein